MAGLQGFVLVMCSGLMWVRIRVLSLRGVGPGGACRRQKRKCRCDKVIDGGSNIASAGSAVKNLVSIVTALI